MILYETSKSTTIPISVDDVKNHLKVSGTGDDSLIDNLIRTACLYAENMCGMSIMQHTWYLKLPTFPDSTGHIELPMCRPMSTAASPVTVKYLLDDTVTTGTTYSLSASYYVVSTYSDPPVLYPSYNNEWPSSVRTDPYEGNVIITYSAGYATLSSCSLDCPEDIKAWLKIKVADMYEHRQSYVEGKNITEVKRSIVDGLLDRYKIGKI